MEELVIHGDKYTIQDDQSGNRKLNRYNAKAGIAVELAFLGENEDIAGYVTEMLKKEFLSRAISSMDI